MGVYKPGRGPGRWLERIERTKAGDRVCLYWQSFTPEQVSAGRAAGQAIVESQTRTVPVSADVLWYPKTAEGDK